jgi:hypothetical protein
MSCLATTAAAALLVVLPHILPAQEHYTLGPVSRITLVDITPGKGTEFWTDLRQNVRPLYDEFKRQGLIMDYAMNVKSTAEGPNDWDVAIILTFKNWAALDTFATKGDSVSMRHYGSYGKRSAAGTRRAEFSKVVGSFLVRGITLKEMPRETSR